LHYGHRASQHTHTKLYKHVLMCTGADVPSQSVTFLPAQQLYTCTHTSGVGTTGAIGGWKPLENFTVKNKNTLLTTCRLNKMQMARQTGSAR